MNKLILKQIEEIGTSEILGKEYRNTNPKNNKKLLKKKNLFNLNNVLYKILTMLVIFILFFCLKNKLNLSSPKALIYFNSNLLKDKYGDFKNLINNLFRYNRYVKN